MTFQTLDSYSSPVPGQAARDSPYTPHQFWMEICVPLSPEPSAGLQDNKTTLRPFCEKQDLLLEVKELPTGPSAE